MLLFLETWMIKVPGPSPQPLFCPGSPVPKWIVLMLIVSHLLGYGIYYFQIPHACLAMLLYSPNLLIHTWQEHHCLLHRSVLMTKFWLELHYQLWNKKLALSVASPGQDDWLHYSISPLSTHLPAIPSEVCTHPKCYWLASTVLYRKESPCLEECVERQSAFLHSFTMKWRKSIGENIALLATNSSQGRVCLFPGITNC